MDELKLTSILREIERQGEFAKVLLESPMRIPPLNIDTFSNNVENYTYTELVKNKLGKPIDDFDGYEVFRYTIGKNVYDIFSNDPLTKAFFMYEIDGNGSFVEKKVWQDEVSLGLCRRIILDYYLSTFGSVISDGVHTELGERYWKKIAGEALKRSYKLFVMDHGKKIQLTDVNEMDTYWGLSPSMETHRFIIEK